MQPIQDKDFDQLFENAFADAEVAPSRDLWNNIESEIAPKKRKKLPVYWLAAAVVLVMATVGILVFQQQDNDDQTKKIADNSIEKISPAIKDLSIKDSIETSITPVEEIKIKSPIYSKPIKALASNNVKTKVSPIKKQKVINVPETQKPEIIIAKVEVPKQDIVKKKIEEAILQTNAETLIASNAATIKADEVIGENIQTENKGIRNVGDVVNLIVNKVDKRKDKFIQFRTDDDDSSLSSINIGPFKFGKNRKK
ncbi:hypothetical protein [Pedobacter mucosus]|uniref:hypothetical protein n=1 Tax=Pedobacter mucosus TaxID=2895286 RepID=UPI001EE3F377|nr:hypothetical protein [Pedobacter mucosus]UKT64368.1 hypothetical protein LOK61_01005 [Pedobacter mucosus]